MMQSKRKKYAQIENGEQHWQQQQHSRDKMGGPERVKNKIKKSSIKWKKEERKLQNACQHQQQKIRNDKGDAKERKEKKEKDANESIGPMMMTLCRQQSSHKQGPAICVLSPTVWFFFCLHFCLCRPLHKLHIGNRISAKERQTGKQALVLGSWRQQHQWRVNLDGRALII